jgi:hypothetical protein
MTNVLPMFIDSGDLPEHPLLSKGHRIIRAAAHYSGIAEVKAMEPFAHKATLATISTEQVNHPFGINFDWQDKPEVDRDATIDFRHEELP